MADKRCRLPELLISKGYPNASNLGSSEGGSVVQTTEPVELLELLELHHGTIGIVERPVSSAAFEGKLQPPLCG